MVQPQKRKKSCVKKSRVVSAVPGTNQVTVYCIHGCGISYTTVPMDVDKPAWHKTLRKLNAHESQRCPRNAACQRCPRKHPRVRVSSTANPPTAAAAAAAAALAAKKAAARAPKACQAESAPRAARSSRSASSAPAVPAASVPAAAAYLGGARAPAAGELVKTAQQLWADIGVDMPAAAGSTSSTAGVDFAFWSSDVSGADKDSHCLDDLVLEAQELENRLNEERAVLAEPQREADLVTGVYWTQPTENRFDASQDYKDEVRRRLAEPLTEEEARRRAAHEFTRRIFPEFRARLEHMRAHRSRSVFWDEHAARRRCSQIARGGAAAGATGMAAAAAAAAAPAAAPYIPAAKRSAAQLASPAAAVPTAAAAAAALPHKKRQRSAPSPPTTPLPFGTIDTPDMLTLKDLEWGLGQQVAVHSRADGGRREGHIVGIGGFRGASVLVQFYAAGGALKQQLHEARGAANGARVRNCVFDETTKISDFAVVQQPPLDLLTTSPAVAGAGASAGAGVAMAGSAGRKIAPLQCDDLLAQLDNDFDDLLSGIDSPFWCHDSSGAAADAATNHPLGGAKIGSPSHGLWAPAFRGGDLSDDEAEDDGAPHTASGVDDDDDDDDARLRAFAAAVAAQADLIQHTPNHRSSSGGSGKKQARNSKRPSITELLNLELSMDAAAAASDPSMPAAEVLAGDDQDQDQDHAVRDLALLFGDAAIADSNCNPFVLTSVH